MPVLTVIRLKPNPTGKDRPPQGGPTPTQLAAEWVDFRNDTQQGVPLDNVALYHVAYPATGDPHWQRITGFTGTLQPGKIVRVHAGRVRDMSVISAEDRVGADFHLFSGEDAYVWNNRRGDSARLKNEARNEEIDRASYGPNPPEGVILVRHGEFLIAPAARAASW